MNSSFNIQYVSHENIDKEKWDHCISQASNGLIYGYSFYLDHMATHWDGLVLEDYAAVMPITWNKKYGIHYLYQPFLCAQLGLFGNNVTTEMLQTFLKCIPVKFRYWDIYLNHGNIFSVKDFELYERKNFVLDLGKQYNELYDGYREHVHRNIRKAQQLGCRVIKDLDAEKVIELALQQMRTHSNESKENVDRFRELYKWLYAKQQATSYGILTSQDELVASSIFFFSHHRAYYILVGNHPNGRAIGASHALIDAFIKDYAGKNLWLDFEGSDIRNLAFFYSSFGAIEENYAAIKLNNLPFYLKWAKK